MWPGLVGKGNEPGQEPPISLERMLELTAGAEVNGQKFDGIDYFLFLPHTDPNASDDELKKILARHYRRFGDGRRGVSREIPQRRADGMPHRRSVQ
jgi:hypothetical protein